MKKTVADLERRMISEALQTTRNNQQQAARVLGLSRQGLINKMKRYRLGIAGSQTARVGFVDRPGTTGESKR
jgi:DNA-binding NtrC family response regulator